MSIRNVVEHELKVIEEIDESLMRMKRLANVVTSDVFKFFPEARQRMTTAALECEQLKFRMLEAISITR